jgi:predicted esterase
MSVYKPAELPRPRKLEGRSFYVLHGRKDFIPMRFPELARDALAEAGAKTKLTVHEGKHGWQGDVFGQIRAGVEWLEGQAAAE